MKRILAFLLVAVMTASVFAGCANTENAVSNGVSESTTSTSETKPQISSAALSKQTNLKSKNTEERMKYLCFMHMCKVVEKDFTNYRIFELKEIQNKVENCDMSYNDIKRTFDFIEREI